MVWQYIYFSTLLKKGLLLTVIRIRGTAETRRCDTDAVRLQVITWNPPLTLCASYLPLPPLTSSAPLFSDPSLIVTLVNLAHGIQGCPKIISFEKSNWHFNFWRSFQSPFFSAALHPYIFATSFAEKMHLPFFHQSLIRETFSRFLYSLQFFHPSLINVPIIHIEGFWNLPVNPAWRVPDFMEEKGLITSIATPCFMAPRP